MARKLTKTRLCMHCDQRFVPAHKTRNRQTCPFCNEVTYKPVAIGALEKQADNLFSRLVRFGRSRRDGTIRCCTCGGKNFWWKVDAGHYMSRSFRAVRWEWDNVWPQCKPCNSGFGTMHWKPKDSVKLAYTTFLDMTLGEGTADALWKRAVVDETKRPRQVELMEMIWTFESQCRVDGLPLTGPCNKQTIPVPPYEGHPL